MDEQVAQLASSPEIAEAEFRALDPRVINLWRLSNLIGYGVLLLMLLPMVVTAFFQGRIYGYLAAGGWLLAALLSLYWSLRRPQRAYRAWGYRIDAKVLETRSGIWFRVRRLLPLNRLQHVDLQRGPLERMYGLASLVLYTAGTSSASISIPGLAAAEAERLRDHLVAIGGDDAV